MPTSISGARRIFTFVASARRQDNLYHMSWTIAHATIDLRRYSWRHDRVLKVIGDFIKANIPPRFMASIDLPDETYNFPHHISPTNLRPDIVWWCNRRKELWLCELTISYETVVADSCAWKTAKNQDLVDAGKRAGFKTTSITIEVGSCGMLSVSDLDGLHATTETHLKSATSLCFNIIWTTLLESFRIWTSRNSVT